MNEKKNKRGKKTNLLSGTPKEIEQKKNQPFTSLGGTKLTPKIKIEKICVN